MSSPSPYPVLRPTTSFSSARHPSMYRQVDYHDRNGIQVVESRRRSPVTSITMSAQRTHTLTSTSWKEQTSSPSRNFRPSSQLSNLQSTPQSMRVEHVTPRPKSKGQVVIVQGPVSVSVDLGKRDVAIDFSTPPPTPKIGRLATPELDDLNERPFCDCCTGVQVVKYCAGCGYELNV